MMVANDPPFGQEWQYSMTAPRAEVKLSGTAAPQERWAGRYMMEGYASMNRNILAAATALALIASGQAMAFQAEPESEAPVAGKTLPDGTTPEERSNTARLNAEQAARAKAENVTYEQEVSAAAQQVAADQAAFAEETAAYEAEKARVAAMSAEERMKWEADVAACKAGDVTRCAKPASAPPPQP